MPIRPIHQTPAKMIPLIKKRKTKSRTIIKVQIKKVSIRTGNVLAIIYIKGENKNYTVHKGKISVPLSLPSPHHFSRAPPTDIPKISGPPSTSSYRPPTPLHMK